MFLKIILNFEFNKYINIIFIIAHIKIIFTFLKDNSLKIKKKISTMLSCDKDYIYLNLKIIFNF